MIYQLLASYTYSYTYDDGIQTVMNIIERKDDLSMLIDVNRVKMVYTSYMYTHTYL